MFAVAIDGIDVIVVDYRTPRDLQEFLDSFVKYAPKVSFDLHVALVQPNHEDVRVAEQYDAVVHIFDENVGYARAVNAVTARCSREVVAIFNADCVLTEDVLDDCYEALLEHDEWACLGPRQVDESNRLTHAGIVGTSDYPIHRAWHVPDNGSYGDIQTDVVTVSGAAIFVRRSVWELLSTCATYQRSVPNAEGAFLPTPHYYEETFFCYHARAHDYKCVYYGPAKMIHKWHRSSPDGGWADQQMVISRTLFRRACQDHSIVCD